MEQVTNIANSGPQIPSPNRYPGTKKIGLWITSLAFNLFVLMSAGTVISSGVNKYFDKEWSWVDLSLYVGLGWLVFSLSRHYATKWRSEDQEINIGLTSFQNPFFDPDFEKGPILLQKKYDDLRRTTESYKIMLDRMVERVKEKELLHREYEEKLIVFLRHHENANRLLSSAAYILNKDQDQLVDEMLNNILAECMTVLRRDKSDKSATIFQVIDDLLKIRHYSRIPADASRKTVFTKGQGFAGHIWKENKATIEKVDGSPHFAKHPARDYKSILGVPISIGDIVLGVLCLQSENEEGFTEEDIRAVQFYANCCSLLFLYDKMEIAGGETL